MKYSRKDLIQDIRELSNILENAHPDPYIFGGGKIAYHRRLQKLIRDIPEEGMTKQEFFISIQSFTAAIEDGHTRIISPFIHDNTNPGGIPLSFAVIEDKVYVDAVTNKQNLFLIGSILVSIEGVLFEEIVKRIEKRYACENLFNKIGYITSIRKLLFYKDELKLLIPEWENKNEIKVVLKHPNGEVKEYKLFPAKDVKYPLLYNKSIIESSETLRGFSYRFFGPQKNIAYFRVDSTDFHQESFDFYKAIGLKDLKAVAVNIYKMFYNKEPRGDFNDIIKEFPSSLEIFTTLFETMKKMNSKYFIVDLRKNSGGTDVLTLYLLYFLVGIKKMSSLRAHSVIQKFSSVFEENTESKVKLENIPYYPQVPLTLNDYNFSNDIQFRSEEEVRQLFSKYEQKVLKELPSFNREYKTREHESYYTPEKIIILSSPKTMSAGFHLMKCLVELGGIIVGIPSGQSGNFFGSISTFELTNTKLKGRVSTNFQINFPDKPMKGYVLEPHYTLTYDKLASFNFDENSTLLYALEIIDKIESQKKDS